MNYPLAADEQQRLESLHRSCLLDTPAEERFDRLTRLARRHFETPVSMITLLDSDRQWFKSAQGHLLSETPREMAFCNYTILGSQPLVIPNALLDERFFDNAVVRGEEGVRFYAGVPLCNEEGHRVGTFCILDVRERQLDAEGLASLEDFAACAESELQRVRLTQAEQQLLSEVDELRRKSLVDPVTRCWKRDTILDVLERQKQLSPNLAVVEIELGGLTALNQSLGTEATDRLLRLFCEQL
ncbi:MAG: GAF domain-containing protein, partial [Candidatus Eremiobacteraeota bacterium]|nr:GAF domain-containing protein [Candidatus Eremiobacteraeota bacterium]